MINIADFDVSAERGFLPKEDPRLCIWYSVGEVAANLPKLLVTNELPRIVKSLPELTPLHLQGLENNAVMQIGRAHV